MMKPVLRVDGAQASAVSGRPVLDLPKAIWNGGMLLAGAALGPQFFTWTALALFATVTYVSLLLGHSVGMHRMMIHRTFKCPKFLEHVLVYVGVAVGMAGPFGIIRIHDTRDWAQRQSACHDFFAHRLPFVSDLIWQLAYRFEFTYPPKLDIEPEMVNDSWYRFLEHSWRWHQLAFAAVFYVMGGWPWVIWGVCIRVSISTIGHWTITYFCHNPGPGRWRVNGACVQASNLSGLGLLTYGECWHNNHHAFPESARIGLDRGQLDPSWWIISLMEKCGLAREVGRPRPEKERDDLVSVEDRRGSLAVVATGRT